MKTAVLQCYVCGKPCVDHFCLATMAEETDRVFTVHGNCAKQLDQKETAIITVLTLVPMQHAPQGRATQLRFAQHTTHPHDAVCEVWHKGDFVAQVTGGDVAGVRVISYHDLQPHLITDGLIQVVEVRINA